MKKLLSIALISVWVLMISWYYIDIKTNKEFEQERAKKQETNNIISWLHQQISWLEQNLISLNKEIDLLQPEKDLESNQVNSGLKFNWNEKIMSGLEFEDSTWTIEAINALEQEPKTWLKLNWIEKLFNWFKKIFNLWKKQENTWEWLSWSNQILENTWLQAKEITWNKELDLWSKPNITTPKVQTIKTIETKTNENICSPAEISACINRSACTAKCRENEEVLKKRSINCEKYSWEWYKSIRDKSVWRFNCVCKEWYEFEIIDIELSDGTMGSKGTCKKI